MPGAARTTTPTDLRAAALAWRHGQAALQCELVEPWEHGVVYRTPSAPNYWDANAVRLDGSPTFAALVRRVDELLGPLRHRKLVVTDEAVGARLRPAFEAAGWICDRNAVLRRAGPAAAHPDVAEVAPTETHPLRIEWYLNYPDEGDPTALAEAQDRVGARRGMRAFVVRDGGSPVGFALLAVGPGAVEIDQLYVTPAARGQGIGARLVESALAAGGQPVAWVVADDEGRARALYERLGFETVWRVHEFVRQP